MRKDRRQNLQNHRRMLTLHLPHLLFDLHKQDANLMHLMN